MRLHRPRISVGMSGVVVAMVAANCAVVRALASRWAGPCRDDPIAGLPAEVLVGLLPLMNAALAGSLLVAARRVRGLRRGAADSRPAPAGFTYFCWHFLALGWFTGMLWPDAILVYLEFLGPVIYFVLDLLETLSERVGLLDRWPVLQDYVIFCEYVLFSLLISGPLLVLCGAGGMLARRYARVLPRWRFRLVAGLISLIFVGTAFAIGVTMRPFQEDRRVPLVFRVVDADSLRPVAGAAVRLIDPFDARETPPVAFADADGRAVLAGHFPASGERSLFQTVGEFSSWGRWLEVSAPGFPTLRRPLTEILGPVVDLHRSRVDKVALARGPAGDEDFGDIAGDWSKSFGMGGRRFTIEPDGRFAWSANSCTWSHMEFGFLRRAGREITMAPIPRPGWEIHPVFRERFRVVPWGDRLYLCTDDRELFHLCRAALADRSSVDPEFRGATWVDARDSDAGKPLTGLPRLPLKTWVGFFADELGRLAAPPDPERLGRAGLSGGLR